MTHPEHLRHYVDVITGSIWVHVRDSSMPDGPHLTFPARDWQRFVNWAPEAGRD